MLEAVRDSDAAWVGDWLAELAASDWPDAAAALRALDERLLEICATIWAKAEAAEPGSADAVHSGTRVRACVDAIRLARKAPELTEVEARAIAGGSTAP